MNIGKSVVIKGELNGSEDLTIEGHVEGKIELRDHVLTIGPNGKIKAQVFAKAVIVLGEVNGNVTATEKVDIRDNGSVDGDIVSPRVAIAEGAHFRGSVDMQRKGAQPAAAAVARAAEGVDAAARAAAQPQAHERRRLDVRVQVPRVGLSDLVLPSPQGIRSRLGHGRRRRAGAADQGPPEVPGDLSGPTAALAARPRARGRVRA